MKMTSYGRPESCCSTAAIASSPELTASTRAQNALERVHQNVPCRGIIIHNQGRDGAKLLGNHPAPRGARGHTHRHRKQKRASGAWFAFEPDLATHEFHQPPANGQAESRSSVFACRGRVGLAEGLKQSSSLLWRHADAGILHRESELDPFADLFQQFRFQVNIAVLGKFDRIIDQVCNHLAQAQWIANQILRNGIRDLGQKFQPFILGFLSRDGGDRGDHVIQAEVHRLDVKPAGFNLRKVEDVIDHPQQRRSRIVNLVDVVPLLLAQRRLQGQVRHADDRIHRSPYLVAHVGQEHGLHLRGLFGSSFAILSSSSVRVPRFAASPSP